MNQSIQEEINELVESMFQIQAELRNFASNGNKELFAKDSCMSKIYDASTWLNTPDTCGIENRPEIASKRVQIASMKLGEYYFSGNYDYEGMTLLAEKNKELMEISIRLNEISEIYNISN